MKEKTVTEDTRDLERQAEEGEIERNLLQD